MEEPAWVTMPTGTSALEAARRMHLPHSAYPNARFIYHDDGLKLSVQCRAKRPMHAGQVATIDHRLLGEVSVDARSTAQSRTARCHNDDIDLRKSTCCVCGKPACKRCAACRSVVFCSIDCQRVHWRAGHQRECGHRGD